MSANSANRRANHFNVNDRHSKSFLSPLSRLAEEPGLLAAFLLPLVYWIYLAVYTRMDIVHDAVAYEWLGKFIYKEGWIAFFKNGPNREPLYPALVALSMRLADLWQVDYQSIQKIIQIFILGLTQWLSYRLMQSLKIHKTVMAVVLLYLGLSPAIVNSAFSLYSEIITYPLMLSLIFVAFYAWKSIRDDKPNQVILWSAAFTVNFLLLTAAKAIFTAVFILFLPLFILLGIHALRHQKRTIVLCTALFLFFTVSLYHISVAEYKFLNWKYNGHFVITDRGYWALYGNTERRMQPMNPRRVLPSLAYAAGEGVCHSLFKEEECLFWSYQTSDMYGTAKQHEVEAQRLPPDKANAVLLSLAKKKAMENPLQYVFFMGVESLKMFFWESTKIGFVTYPGQLKKIFDFTLLKNGLRFGLFLLSLSSFLLTWTLVIKNRRKIFNAYTSQNEELLFCFFILVSISAFVLAYSFFFVLTRYALPVAPLFLILIAYTLNKLSARGHLS
jgi:hypothetical protein